MMVFGLSNKAACRTRRCDYFAGAVALQPQHRRLKNPSTSEIDAALSAAGGSGRSPRSGQPGFCVGGVPDAGGLLLGGCIMLFAVSIMRVQVSAIRDIWVIIFIMPIMP
jgi:hypothetical protein